MKYESERFVLASEAEKEDVGGGVVRQIMGFNDDLMLVRVCFSEGAIGYTHAHPHSQVAFVESGEFEFTIGDDTKTLKAGDCAYVPPNADHGAVCKEEGVLLDIFSPVREDFLEG
ncbi:MAG: cupin domain-containing protein [Xanthomonadales bacterium]|nr:cupin domain-containing protein [Gammaproteobacteria bacterium]MBT8051049.1 cupin domain-containing protein [Gammaproteobacteria bacterium]MBT8056479.1 cupin domain-containing protein [Gammaproteobacteria bacterium]NNJ79600.1 cupin domain-containing protein [Xanthomonadales bacterium]NNL04171.1 cupin domain-containing protein [Xanthomonadales bacterium]